MIEDYSLIAVALLLQAHDDLEKTRRNAREHLEMIDSMSRASRSFGTFLRLYFQPIQKQRWFQTFVTGLLMNLKKRKGEGISPFI